MMAINQLLYGDKTNMSGVENNTIKGWNVTHKIALN